MAFEVGENVYYLHIIVKWLVKEMQNSLFWLLLRLIKQDNLEEFHELWFIGAVFFFFFYQDEKMLQ